MKPTVLISDFLGRISFPHYLKKKDSDKAIEAEIVFDPDVPVEVGGMVTLIELQKNTRIFEVTKVVGKRKAKGDWSFSNVWPSWCKIEAKHVGFWNAIKEHPDGGVVSPEYITDKKVAA